MIAKRMGLAREEVARIRTAAAIHDIGKMGTPKAILHKPGPLDDAEYAVIKRHPGAGARMAAVLGDAKLTEIVRDHHERLDGSGYPGGLAGAQIPLGARIIAVADTFDAITSARPYRAASPQRKALDILRSEAGARLDPAAVRAFCGHYAGRRALALWTLAAGIPEWLAASLGGGVAALAAARIPALAALLGGVVAGASHFALPAAEHHHAAGRSPSHTLLLARTAPRTASSAPRSLPAVRRDRPDRPLRPRRSPPPSRSSPANGVQAPPQTVAAGEGRAARSENGGSSAGGVSAERGSPGAGEGATEVGETVNGAGGTVEEAGNTTKGEEVLTGAKETADAAAGAAEEAVNRASGEVKEAPARVEGALGKLP